MSLTVVFLRVSSPSQHLEMQKDAATPYIALIPEDKLHFIEENGVSALKIRAHKRIGFQELFYLIDRGKVTKLITFARDRLARNTYEYANLVKLILAHHVEVVFTATGISPFSKNFPTEIRMGHAAQMEGENIRRRNLDSLEANPRRVRGYKYDKNIGHSILPNEARLVNEIFQSFVEVDTYDDAIRILCQYKKILRVREEETIIRILSRIFYAFSHIPIVPEDLFFQVEEKLEKLDRLQAYLQSKRLFKGIVEPVCGICHRTMKWDRFDLLDPGTFVCSNKQHQRVEIHSDILSSKVQDEMKHLLSCMNTEKLKEDVDLWVKKKRRALTSEMSILERTISKLSHKIARDPYVSVPLLNEKRELEKKYEKLNAQIEDVYAYLSQTNQIIDGAKKNLKNNYLKAIAQKLVQSASVFADGRIELVLYFSDYFDHV